ncbi:MAG: nucleotidyltransferase substrate binding protein [Saprospiraceae bacterium]
MEEDIKWKQRFPNFRKALNQLQNISKIESLSEVDKLALIKTFELTHELSWKVMKDFFEMQGSQGIMGSRDATREAFQKGLIEDGESWMKMIKSRNLSAHAYNEEIADEIVSEIVSLYEALFVDFKHKMSNYLKNE